MSVAAHPARARLRELLRQPEEAIDLAEAALCIAWEDQGQADVAGSLGRLDELAEGARPLLRAGDEPRRQVAALNRYLFDELGFCGNQDDYDNPRNSYLDQVLARRTGLPITLSLVYCEVARRLDLPIYGVGMPRHFIVRYLTGGGLRGDLFIDPFGGGRIWSRAECEERLAAAGVFGPEAVERLLAPVGKGEILARMLRNLKAAYTQRGDGLLALAAVERILLISPDEPTELRDRGALRARLGLLAAALDDFERYVGLVPRAPDLPSVKRQALALVRLLGRRN
jgi:regulator of sirC expression with transglutaminase-like and TPR domain